VQSKRVWAGALVVEPGVIVGGGVVIDTFGAGADAR